MTSRAVFVLQNISEMSNVVDSKKVIDVTNLIRLTINKSIILVVQHHTNFTYGMYQVHIRDIQYIF